jgi:hypothetical protein
MGLLDDAIREHLELKRRHGADPNEVERQEQEALGAARRAEFAKAAEVERDEEPALAAPFDAAADEPEATPVPDEPPEFDDRTRVVDEVGPTEEAAAPGYDEDPWLDEERDEVPSEEALQPARPEPEAAESETAKPEQEQEDVLEETPEFLQETPEHDRLWFEQRPPRDFDWDK